MSFVIATEHVAIEISNLHDLETNHGLTHAGNDRIVKLVIDKVFHKARVGSMHYFEDFIIEVEFVRTEMPMPYIRVKAEPVDVEPDWEWIREVESGR